jgi:pSer/pThr/pTyr-binding forkhead associated (FHA) protein
MATGAAELEVVAGKAAGMSILVDDELLIGRHAEGAGQLAHDDEISRAHARVTLDGSGFCAIEDLESTNGTYVNGLRIATPTTLERGDTIELGATTLVVRNLPGTGDRTPADDASATASGPAAPRARPLTFTLEIDFAAGEVRLQSDDAPEPVRLGFNMGPRHATPPHAQPIEKGAPR